jgi:hypothetical protein
MWVWNNGGMTLTGEKFESTLRKTLLTAIWTAVSVTWTELASNPDLCSERLAINHVILQENETALCCWYKCVTYVTRF